MQDNSAGGRNALCPGCPYRAPAAAMGRLWLRGVAGGGCAGLCAGRPLLAVEERAGERRAVSVLAQRLREGAKRSELVALLPADELDGPALAELEESGGIALAVGSALPAGLAAGPIP